jgi:hypothetical protein
LRKSRRASSSVRRSRQPGRPINTISTTSNTVSGLGFGVVTRNVPAPGRYVITVTGVGYINPADYWSSYASLEQYDITVSYGPGPRCVVCPVAAFLVAMFSALCNPAAVEEQKGACVTCMFSVMQSSEEWTPAAALHCGMPLTCHTYSYMMC